MSKTLLRLEALLNDEQSILRKRKGAPRLAKISEIMLAKTGENTTNNEEKSIKRNRILNKWTTDKISTLIQSNVAESDDRLQKQQHQQLQEQRQRCRPVRHTRKIIDILTSRQQHQERVCPSSNLGNSVTSIVDDVSHKTIQTINNSNCIYI